MKASHELITQETNHSAKGKTISILFTTYTDFVSRLVWLLSGFRCTHVSLSLDDNDEYFYAFNTKGFKKEYPRKHRKRTKENTCLRLRITEDQYNELRCNLKKFDKNKNKYTYDYLGVTMCMFRLARRENRKKYFCSSFISELLQKANVIKLKKKNNRYLPYQLQKELLLCPLLISIAQNIFIA